MAKKINPLWIILAIGVVVMIINNLESEELQAVGDSICDSPVAHSQFCTTCEDSFLTDQEYRVGDCSLLINVGCLNDLATHFPSEFDRIIQPVSGGPITGCTSILPEYKESFESNFDNWEVKSQSFFRRDTGWSSDGSYSLLAYQDSNEPSSNLNILRKTIDLTNIEQIKFDVLGSTKFRVAVAGASSASIFGTYSGSDNQVDVSNRNGFYDLAFWTNKDNYIDNIRYVGISSPPPQLECPVSSGSQCTTCNTLVEAFNDDLCSSSLKSICKFTLGNYQSEYNKVMGFPEPYFCATPNCPVSSDSQCTTCETTANVMNKEDNNQCGTFLADDCIDNLSDDFSSEFDKLENDNAGNWFCTDCLGARQNAGSKIFTWSQSKTALNKNNALNAIRDWANQC